MMTPSEHDAKKLPGRKSALMLAHGILESAQSPVFFLFGTLIVRGKEDPVLDNTRLVVTEGLL